VTVRRAVVAGTREEEQENGDEDHPGVEESKRRISNLYHRI
jgi:hypothetical protein